MVILCSIPFVCSPYLYGVIYTHHPQLLVFIVTEGYVSTVSENPYLSCYHDHFYNVSIQLIVHPHILGRYSHIYNSIDQHNKMGGYDIVLDKYWVTLYAYFMIGTTVQLDTRVIGANIIFCHVIESDKNDKDNTKQYHHNKTVFD